MDRVKLLAQISGAGQSLDIPAQVFAKLDSRTARIQLKLIGHVRVLQRYREAVANRRRRPLVTAFEQVTRLVEYPWLAERSTRDHDTRAVGLLLHHYGVFRRLDVAVAKHRNFERGNDCGNLVPARGTAIHLRARARVQRKHGCAGVLAPKSNLDRIAHLLAPSATDLDGNGKRGSTRYGTDDRLDQAEILETAGSTVALHDLLYRTAEIDIDEFRLEHIRNEPRGVAHRGSFGPKNLYADRALICPKTKLGERSFILSPNCFSRKELRYHNIRPEPTADPTKWRLRHPRHGREIQWRIAAEGEWKWAGHPSQANVRGRTRQRVYLTLVGPETSLDGSPRYAPPATTEMELREFFSEDAISLDLKADNKDDILRELISLLKLDEKSEGMLFKMLKRRENLGSTGIGRGIAIPHCRSLVVNKLRVAFGRKPAGVDFKAIDEKPVYFFFLIVAPPLEVSNQYLPVLGKIAQFSKESDVPDRLVALTEPSQFMALLKEKGV